MQLTTFTFRPESGWSVPKFPPLDSEQTLVLVFAASEFFESAAPITELRQAFPKSKLLGCSAAGEILGALVNDASLSVAVVRFARAHVELGFTHVSESDSFAAGERLAQQLPHAGLRGVLVLSDGLDVNGSALVRGLSQSLPPGIAITGGLAADGQRFEGTWVVRADGALIRGGAAVAGFYGNSLRMGYGSRGGWDVFGPERRVTRATGNVLYELDGKPALALYKEYLGEQARNLPAAGLLFPLAVRRDADDDAALVRCITAVDESQQSMTFAGDIPNGHLAQLMQANFDRLVTGASDAAQLAASGVARGNGPVLSIAISCVGRRMVLGERIEEETEAVLGNLPTATQQVGFYSYGEICPYNEGPSELHNQTMTLTSIAED